VGRAVKQKIQERPTQRDPFLGRYQWEKWKREAASLEYAEAAMMVLNAAGKVTRQKYLEMMLEMEEKFPGRGWREQMDSLEAFYYKEKMVLKDFPRSGHLAPFISVSSFPKSLKKKTS